VPTKTTTLDDVVAALEARIAELEARLVIDDPGGRLVAALAAAQGRFPHIAKTKTATVRPKNGGSPYSYSYADLADVLDAVRPVLAREGLAIAQPTEYGPDGRLYLATRLLHTSGGSLTATIALGQDPGQHQAFGGALTYLRRYALTTLLGIQADEDDDGANAEPVATVEPAPEWAAPLTNRDAKRKAIDQAAELIGDAEAAVELLKAGAEAYGGIPHIVADLLNALVEARAAVSAARAQDAAAEQPDPPAPEPGDQSPTPLPAQAERALADAAQDDEPPPPAPATELAPSSVEVERPLPADPAVRTGILRAAGCVCADPVEAEVREGARAPECPIVGHGIPF
jgi:hypothetical protein